MSGWDVVNEAINDGGDATTGATENLRDSRWLQTVGPDFLTQAFRFAREADPNVPLHYNDYSIESGFKHQSSLALLKRLIADGAPITTVGIQGHWSLAGLTPERYQQIDDAIAHYKALKLKVAISELDVTLSGAGGGQLGGGGRGTPPPPPTAEQLQAQAEAYGKLFGIFVKHRDAVDRVTFWGLHHRRSWQSGRARSRSTATANPSRRWTQSSRRLRSRRRSIWCATDPARRPIHLCAARSGCPSSGPAQSIVAARDTMASIPTGLDYQ